MSYFRLSVSTSSLVWVTKFHTITHLENFAEPSACLSNFHHLSSFLIIELVHDFRAVEADSPQYLSDILNQTSMIDRSSQLNMTEMTWAIRLSYRLMGKGRK